SLGAGFLHPLQRVRGSRRFQRGASSIHSEGPRGARGGMDVRGSVSQALPALLSFWGPPGQGRATTTRGRVGVLPRALTRVRCSSGLTSWRGEAELPPDRFLHVGGGRSPTRWGSPAAGAESVAAGATKPFLNLTRIMPAEEMRSSWSGPRTFRGAHRSA